MVTPKQANADITSVKKHKEGERGRRREGKREEGGRWGKGGQNEYKKIKNKKREIKRYRSDGDDEGRDRGRRGREAWKEKDVNNNQQRTESQGKAKISIRRSVINNNNNNITAT